VLATELIEIKAYSILDKEKKVERVEDLEKRILEYKLFKEISEIFSENEHEYNIPYTRKGNVMIEEALIEYDISSLNLTSLFNSFKQLITTDIKLKDSISLDLEEDYSIDDANDEIEEHLVVGKKVSFSTLLNNKYTKARIVSLFLATLDMFKTGKIDIEVEEKEFYLVKVA
jgi:segregation and condensation protein A